MIEAGALLVLVGAALLVAEAHVPAGILGVGGGVALAGGAALAIGGAGGSLAVVLAAMLAALAVIGRQGVVRTWSGAGGQVLVDGALWRARRSLADDEEGELGVGDSVVVERVNGLTLAVRRAEDWEEAW